MRLFSPLSWMAYFFLFLGPASNDTGFQSPSLPLNDSIFPRSTRTHGIRMNGATWNGGWEFNTRSFESATECPTAPSRPAFVPHFGITSRTSLSSTCINKLPSHAEAPGWTRSSRRGTKYSADNTLCRRSVPEPEHGTLGTSAR